MVYPTHFIVYITKNMTTLSTCIVVVDSHNKTLSTMHPTSSFNISKRTNSSLTDSSMFLIWFVLNKNNLPLDHSREESNGNECLVFWNIFILKLLFTSYYFKLVDNNTEPSVFILKLFFVLYFLLWITRNLSCHFFVIIIVLW